MIRQKTGKQLPPQIVKDVFGHGALEPERPVKKLLRQPLLPPLRQLPQRKVGTFHSLIYLRPTARFAFMI